MKEGLYYKDKRTDEILFFYYFTRSCHMFINQNNVCIERPKYNVYERVKVKEIIAKFEESRNGKPRKNVREKLLISSEEIMNFNEIYD